MSLSELCGIGKRSRHAVADIKSASTSAARTHRSNSNQRPLVEALDDDDSFRDDSTSIDHDIDGKGQADYLQVKAAPSSNLPNHKSRPRCLICRRVESKYNCPNCNIPYCSLECYRAEQHVNCSQPFSRKTMQAELGLQGNDGVDEKERLAMMELLRRHKLSEEDQGEVDVDEGSYDQEEEGLREQAYSDEIDLDNASVEQMLNLLTDEERQLFETTIRERNEGKSRKLLEKLMHDADSKVGSGLTNIHTKPWWDADPRLVFGPAINKIYKSATKLGRQISSNGQKKVDLTYNVICVLLCYVYLVRHLDVQSLQDALIDASNHKSGRNNGIGDEADDMPPLESIDEAGSDGRQDALEEKENLRSLVVEKTKRLLPFLDSSGVESKTILSSAEEASFWLAARLGGDIITEAATLLLFLFKYIKALFNSPRVVDVEAPLNNKIVLALCDLAVHLGSSSQRKLIFYAAYWLGLDQISIKELEQQIDLEMQRLQDELDRDQDEARFAAANEAIQQQIVLP